MLLWKFVSVPGFSSLSVLMLLTFGWTVLRLQTLFFGLYVHSVIVVLPAVITVVELEFSQHVCFFFRGWQLLSHFTVVLSRLFLLAISLLARESDVKKSSMMTFLYCPWNRSVRCIATQAFASGTVSPCVKGWCWVCIWCPKFDAKLDFACSVLGELALQCHLA